MLPTPAGFGEALALLADRREGDAVAVDLGGATCLVGLVGLVDCGHGVLLLESGRRGVPRWRVVSSPAASQASSAVSRVSAIGR